MIFLDAHLHIYPEYDLDIYFDTLVKNAKKYAPEATAIAGIVLLRENQPSLASLFEDRPHGKWSITLPSDAQTAATVTDGTTTIALFPARQIAARERIELLALFGEKVIADGQPLSETITQIRQEAMQPVIAWGKGKWLLKRHKIVKALIRDEAKQNPLPLIGDSALRPLFWIEPLFRFAKRNGMRLIYGSDPLPGKDNETKPGTYATLIDAPIAYKYDELQKLLNTAAHTSCGKRPLL